MDDPLLFLLFLLFLLGCALAWYRADKCGAWTSKEVRNLVAECEKQRGRATPPGAAP